jgi:putative endonuclease
MADAGRQTARGEAATGLGPTAGICAAWRSSRSSRVLVRCADGTLYTGIALDVAGRIAAHDDGRGARYTRGRGLLVLCATRRCASKSEALRLELAVKRR